MFSIKLYLVIDRKLGTDVIFSDEKAFLTTQSKVDKLESSDCNFYI
jgi:hypothetical protein